MATTITGTSQGTAGSTAGPTIADKNKAASQTDALAQAKDKAQIAATGAMSVAHIAILRQILDRGPDASPYYVTSLALLGVALTLQALAGLITMCTGNLMGYYTKYKGSALQDLTGNLCCCKIIKKTSHQATPFGLDYAVDGQPDADCEEPGGCCPCCGCQVEVGATGFSQADLNILHHHDDWLKQHTEAALLYEKARIELEDVNRVIAEAEKTLASSAEGEADEMVAKTQETLGQAQSKKQELEAIIFDQEVSEAQGAFLQQRADDIRQESVYKTVSFWQQMVNYAFYVVFIIDAFITGFAIASIDA